MLVWPKALFALLVVALLAASCSPVASQGELGIPTTETDCSADELAIFAEYLKQLTCESFEREVGIPPSPEGASMFDTTNIVRLPIEPGEMLVVDARGGTVSYGADQTTIQQFETEDGRLAFYNAGSQIANVAARNEGNEPVTVTATTLTPGP